MELHPIVESLSELRPNIWCVLSPSGDGPTERVGHTCLFFGGKNDGDRHRDKSQILVIGGANPDGPFNEVYSIDIDTLVWNKTSFEGLLPRYEHSSFVPQSHQDKIVVFGGASKSDNLNDIQELDSATNKCSNIEASGPPPSGRTCHCMASIGDDLYIFGGGYKGADPVKDQEMYVFNAVSKTWSQVEAKGEKPCSRHGHLMVAIGTDIYVHGGMAGTKVFDDLYKFSIDDCTWHELSPSGDVPSARTAHTGTVINSTLYMFGGMNNIGAALDDFYKLNTETLCWNKIKLDTLPPNPRLDHAMCTLSIPNVQDEKPSADSNVDVKTSHIIFLFGGMDTSGVILNDCFVFLPTD